MEEVRANFSCSQDELYSAIKLIIKSYVAEQAKFFELREKYTLIFGEQLNAENEAAMLLPGDSQRLGEQGILRELMLEKLKLSLDMSGRLRLYIRDAYPVKAIRDLRLQVAGFDDYVEASRANWEKLSILMNRNATFIAEHEAELLANNNMPATFKATFDALNTEVQAQITEMLDYRENNKQATAAKLKALNAIYAKIIDLCEDGAFLFKDDMAKRVQFIFGSVLEVITPPGASSLTVKVTRVSDGTPVLNANVKINKEGTPERQAMNTAEGAYFANLPAGTYSVQVDIEGQVSFVSIKEVETGVNARLDVQVGV